MTPPPPPGPRVAIMQPTFLPWLGYFAMMAAVDRFVYLDTVQLVRRSWQVRNRLKGADGPVLLSLELRGRPSRPLIGAARLADTPFRPRLLASLRHLLGRAPHFAPVQEIVAGALDAAGDSLADLNIAVIEGVAGAAGIATPRLRASALAVPEGAVRADRLLAITRAAGGRCYVSAPGSHAYLKDDNPFAGSEVALRFFDFAHPEYPQFHPPFLPYMSALDALAHVGPEGFAALLRAGTRPLQDLAGMAARRDTPADPEETPP